jgi:hypothetical protein
MPAYSATRPLFAGWLLVAMGLVYPVVALAEQDVLVDVFGADWRYLDNGSDQGTAWRARTYDDSAWKTGDGILGYGYGDETTLIDSGPPGAHFMTTYYRCTFNVADPSAYTDLVLGMLRDDGVVVYINGSEVFRDNMPAGKISANTPASSEIVASASADAGVQTGIERKYLRSGSNTIAVEVHQSSADSPDAVFALQLDGNYTASDVDIFSRAPYLQMITPTSAVIRWDTIQKSNSVVRFGVSPDNLLQRAKNNQLVNHHEVKLTGLDPATTYYYSVGSSKKTLGIGPGYFFKTQPPVGAHPPTRLWVIGDSGRGNQGQRDVYQGYLDFAGSRYTDLWLMLGDNAYGSGTYKQYQDNFFNIYPELLRQTVVWPTLGNHDGYSVNTPEQTGPYYENFTLPTAGEAGGLASGTEAYYSYNYGNIHFVVLDSFDVDRSTSGAMAQWLEADLAANTADWVIAYWHHPAYSKGTHDSDTEFELIEMRENILPILEQHGVDLVLAGHSHNYERSKFVDGHYGNSSTYSDGLFALDIGSGDVTSGAAAYTKAHPAIAHGGTVYAVAGTSAAAEGGAMNHPVMYTSFSKLGSMVIDIDHLLLSAKFIDDKGEVQDAFTLQKLSAGPDRDGDDVLDIADNCIVNANRDQHDADGDGMGDVCDSGTDTDGDGIGDSVDTNDDNDALDDVSDNCVLTANDDQKDYNADGRGDACDPVPVFGMGGMAPKDKAGHAVAFAGDINADGYGDYVVGIPGYDVPATDTTGVIKDAGRAVVISGKTGAELMSLNGNSAKDSAGFAVTGNGDIDHDGFDDVIVGAPMADDIANGRTDAGSVTILFGPDGIRKHVLYGSEAGSLSGSAVALGDVNGDSYADVVVGAPRADDIVPGFVDAGRVTVFSGSDYGALNSFSGSASNAHMGASVAAGDLDNNGAADIIIGSPDMDDSVRGVKDAGMVIAFGVSGNELLRKYGQREKSYLGSAVASGDVNNDGYSDVAAGAPGDWNGTLPQAGSVTVFSGNGGGELARKFGATKKAGAGYSVTTGDINSDNFADIIVGAHKDDAPGFAAIKDVGSVYVWSGSNFTLLDSFYGDAAQDYSGVSVSAGDVNGDGKLDIIIGVAGADGESPPPLKDAGMVKIISGISF